MTQINMMRCVCNDECNGGLHHTCFKDKLQDDALYSRYKYKESCNCLIDYLFLVRLQVKWIVEDRMFDCHEK